jgi:hypothetical protein
VQRATQGTEGDTRDRGRHKGQRATQGTEGVPSRGRKAYAWRDREAYPHYLVSPPRAWLSSNDALPLVKWHLGSRQMTPCLSSSDCHRVMREADTSRDREAYLVSPPHVRVRCGRLYGTWHSRHRASAYLLSPQVYMAYSGPMSSIFCR